MTAITRINRYVITSILISLSVVRLAIASEPLVAAVFEIEDGWTHSTGAAELLKQSGFLVRSVDPAAALSLSGVDLLFLGSFVSEHPQYKAFMEKNYKELVEYVGTGGVIVQMTQADQTEKEPAFLPESLKAIRGDDDFESVLLIGKDHPILEGLTGPKQRFTIPGHLGHPSSWESFQSQSGFQVLLSSVSQNEFSLLEGAYGAGRIILSSMFLDKIYRQSTAVADTAYVELSQHFFANIRTYVEKVRNHTAPEVKPTVPVEEIVPSRVSATKSEAALPFVPGSWTIVVLPDTQFYSQSFPEIFQAQTQWIVENAKEYNIQFVLHLGDIVNNNTPEQWEVAKKAMSELDGKVPYAFVTGNHDYGKGGLCQDRQTYLNDYFQYENYKNWPTFGGAMESGKMENTFHLFHAGDSDWLVLALEWGPRKEVVRWANDVVERYPECKVILITHAYLYKDDTRYDWKSKNTRQEWNPHSYGTASDTTYDGEELWQELVRSHPGFFMVLSGHVLGDGTGRLVSQGDHGNIVYQILANYQTREKGGGGLLRLIEFLPDRKTIQIKTYSPYLKTYLTDPDNQFTLDSDPGSTAQ